MTCPVRNLRSGHLGVSIEPLVFGHNCESCSVAVHCCVVFLRVQRPELTCSTEGPWVPRCFGHHHRPAQHVCWDQSFRACVCFRQVFAWGWSCPRFTLQPIPLRLLSPHPLPQKSSAKSSPPAAAGWAPSSPSVQICLRRVSFGPTLAVSATSALSAPLTTRHTPAACFPS